MRTLVYINKAGERVAVFHATKNGRESWEHPYSVRETCSVCTKDGAPTHIRANPDERTSAQAKDAE